MIITEQGFAVVETDSHISKWVIENKRLDFDQNSMPEILRYINEGDSIIDVGANIGCYSYGFLNKIGHEGHIVCYECNPTAFECLKYNLGKYDNVMLFKIAIGDMTGNVKIAEDINLGASHCYLDPEGHIPMRTIDSFNLQKVDFIKIDAEGWELHILRGAAETIKKFHPKLYIEINKGTLARCGVTADEIFSFLNVNGYSYNNIYREQLMEGDQYDIICF